MLSRHLGNALIWSTPGLAVSVLSVAAPHAMQPGIWMIGGIVGAIAAAAGGVVISVTRHRRLAAQTVRSAASAPANYRNTYWLVAPR